ncbi:uncharacterized protein SPPG_07712 [Spizellomyces punctatus DAOM BR117]|uniref:Tudor domain-containing protein n=1 Tax=Spizellomyces punctatus (strain DAOM BR117) TaxID=645134 RepID=A0A0L0H6M1_SPIPD|nr:uncharacterized protein SPPG_07712 [Spizellomyces punctatus DAOM BR117]KNC96882.1 hypothetical protein SPPG_07712 [Spizellomyces punctatus DAOM BR117]|eukprot:XP_016604922.1 hypothetical protein SPPG_07712 [Spizellomyces punctatus DAOM BR117]
MAEELAQYQFQLDQVDEAIAKDPDNPELHKLRENITELINLYSEAVKQQQQTATITTSDNKRKRPVGGYGEEAAKKICTVGATVMAKFSGDGKYYEAVIDAVLEESTTADGSSKYMVTFKGYGNQETVMSSDIRPVSTATTSQSAAKKRPIAPPVTPATTAATNPDVNKKKKKFKSKDGASVSKRDKEQLEKQKAWLSFATGDSKKRKASVVAAKPPLKKPSIFATPDDPMAKVGVIGSGKPMTQFQQRGKHIFMHGE